MNKNPFMFIGVYGENTPFMIRNITFKLSNGYIECYIDEKEPDYRDEKMIIYNTRGFVVHFIYDAGRLVVILREGKAIFKSAYLPFVYKNHLH